MLRFILSVRFNHIRNVEVAVEKAFGITRDINVFGSKDQQISGRLLDMSVKRIAGAAGEIDDSLCEHIVETVEVDDDRAPVQKGIRDVLGLFK